MVNWRKYKIESKLIEKWNNSIDFSLDKDVPCLEDGRARWFPHIICVDCSPFDTWQVGDYIEIDIDKARNYKVLHSFNDTNIVRKFGSSAVVPSNSSQQLTMDQFQVMGNQMMDRAERSNGQMEARWIARQEYNVDGSVKAREFGWVYKKSN